MFRCKSNKQAVIIAALIIMLCLVSLIGATFALFTGRTDDGAVGVITTAGYIDVDIVDTSADNNSLVGSYLKFQTSSNQKEILFEPGATYYTQGFKVENKGNISIQFRLSVSDSIKTDEDVKISMEEFNEYFEMWISTSPNSMDNATKTTEFVGNLGAESLSTDTYYLFIRMREDVGNAFKGKEYSGIGVTVYATQSNVDVSNIGE